MFHSPLFMNLLSIEMHSYKFLCNIEYIGLGCNKFVTIPNPISCPMSPMITNYLPLPDRADRADWVQWANLPDWADRADRADRACNQADPDSRRQRCYH